MTTYTKENNITTCKFRINAFLIAKSIVNNIFKHSILNTRLQLALANFKRELKYVAYNYIIEKYKHLIVEEETFSNYINAGAQYGASVTVKGIGNYYGTPSKTYEIAQKSANLSKIRVVLEGLESIKGSLSLS